MIKVRQAGGRLPVPAPRLRQSAPPENATSALMPGRACSVSPRLNAATSARLACMRHTRPLCMCNPCWDRFRAEGPPGSTVGGCVAPLARPCRSGHGPACALAGPTAWAPPPGCASARRRRPRGRRPTRRRARARAAALRRAMARPRRCRRPRPRRRGPRPIFAGDMMRASRRAEHPAARNATRCSCPSSFLSSCLLSSLHAGAHAARIRW